MRRYFCLLLTLLLLFSGCGIQAKQESGGETVSFYYGVQNPDELGEDTVSKAETRHMDVLGLQDLLEIYFRGPQSENLVSPFPGGIRVLGVVNRGERYDITLSGEFFTMSGIDQSVALYCLAQTVWSYTGADQIYVLDELNRISLSLDPDNYLLQDRYHQETNEVFTLYFADPGHRYLQPEIREVILSENESREAYVLRQLIAGPETPGLEPILPEGTELISVTTDNGCCTVDFSAKFFYHAGEDPYADYMALYGVINTLTCFSDVSEVLITMDGHTVEHYGVFLLDQPLMRYGGAIGTKRSSGSEQDVYFYVISQDNANVFAVPASITLTAQQPLFETVLTYALNYEPPRGFYSPIPYGTELLSVSVSGGTCYVDVSSRFVPQENTATAEWAAVWALTSTLFDLEEISSVMLTIEGETDGLRYIDISTPLTRDMIQYP